MSVHELMAARVPSRTAEVHPFTFKAEERLHGADGGESAPAQLMVDGAQPLPVSPLVPPSERRLFPLPSRAATGHGRSGETSAARERLIFATHSEGVFRQKVKA